ncbi:MAG: Crp/Fnr family transcriptional regulator [Clostridia bacterium]|nr:Crp/Fnr family transcriptional regulator [Clostridia bacterium]
MQLNAEDLRKVSIFAGLDEEARAYLAAHSRVHRYPKGAILFFEGDEAEQLYFVIRGAVRVFQSLSDGREFTLEHLGPWEVLAAVCFFDGGPYPASAETLEASAVAQLDYRVVAHLMETRPNVALAFLRMLCGRLRRAHARATDLAIRNVHERLASILLQLREDQSRAGTGLLPARAADLGRLIGAARETVTRALHDFARQGAVVVERGRVRVTDPDKLRTWVQFPSQGLPDR